MSIEDPKTQDKGRIIKRIMVVSRDVVGTIDAVEIDKVAVEEIKDEVISSSNRIDATMMNMRRKRRRAMMRASIVQ